MCCHDTVFGKVTAQCIDQLRSLPDEKVPGSKQHCSRLLRFALHGYEAHCRPRSCLHDGLGVRRIILLPLHERPYVDRGNEPHHVPDPFNLTPPSVSGRAGLHCHDAKWLRCEKRQKALPGQLLSKEYRAVRRSAVQLKDPLREVNADNRNLRHGCRSFSWPAEGRQGIHCNAAGRGHPRHQNKRSPCAGSRWPAEARGSRVPEPSALSPHPWEHQRAHHCRARPSSPTHAASAPCSRSWRRSTRPPPSARHARLRDPKPFAPRGRAPRKRTCWSSCLSWPHLLRSRSLRSTRSVSGRLFWLYRAVDDEGGEASDGRHFEILLNLTFGRAPPSK